MVELFVYVPVPSFRFSITTASFVRCVPDCVFTSVKFTKAGSVLGTSATPSNLRVKLICAVSGEGEGEGTGVTVGVGRGVLVGVGVGVGLLTGANVYTAFVTV